MKVKNIFGLYLLLVTLAVPLLGYSQGNIAPMSINVGFNNGTLLRTDSAALTVWGKTIVFGPEKANTDISINTDLAIFPEVVDYLLWVERGVLTSWFRYNEIDTWADYVLEETYQLMPLEQVGAFVAENKHLPGVPSAAALDSLGHFSMQEMDKITLAKIEELTLYLIAQEKTITQLEEAKSLPDLDKLKKLLDELGKGDLVETTNVENHE